MYIKLLTCGRWERLDGTWLSSVSALTLCKLASVGIGCEECVIGLKVGCGGGLVHFDADTVASTGDSNVDTDYVSPCESSWLGPCDVVSV